jgi:hypothetical protein
LNLRRAERLNPGGFRGGAPASRRGCKKLTAPPVTCSGAMYSGVPRIAPPPVRGPLPFGHLILPNGRPDCRSAFSSRATARPSRGRKHGWTACCEHRSPRRWEGRREPGSYRRTCISTKRLPEPSAVELGSRRTAKFSEDPVKNRAKGIRRGDEGLIVIARWDGGAAVSPSMLDEANESKARSLPGSLSSAARSCDCLC